MASRIDIDMYGASPDQMVCWLRGAVGPLSESFETPPYGWLYECVYGTILISRVIAGDRPYVSIGLDFLGPWEGALACASEAALDLGCPAICMLADRTVEVGRLPDGSVRILTLLVAE